MEVEKEYEKDDPEFVDEAEAIEPHTPEAKRSRSVDTTPEKERRSRDMEAAEQSLPKELQGLVQLMMMATGKIDSYVAQMQVKQQGSVRDVGAETAVLGPAEKRVARRGEQDQRLLREPAGRDREHEEGYRAPDGPCRTISRARRKTSARRWSGR